MARRLRAGQEGAYSHGASRTLAEKLRMGRAGGAPAGRARISPAVRQYGMVAMAACMLLGFAIFCLSTALYTWHARVKVASKMAPPDWWGSNAADFAALRKGFGEELSAQDLLPRPLDVYEKLAKQAGGKKGPVKLKYPILWQSAFWSHSGYGTEAVSFIMGLLKYALVEEEDIWIIQKGDAVHPSVVNSLPRKMKDMLEKQDISNITKRISPAQRNRPLISICHCFPDCWRSTKDESWLYPLHYTKAVERMFKQGLMGQPEESGCPCPDMYTAPRVVYRIGRSMFETESLPSDLAKYTKQLDEVWVPSKSSVASFQKGGVDPLKLSTLPQGVDLGVFDPDNYQPYDLSQGTQIMGNMSFAGARSPSQAPTFRFLSVFKWEKRKGWDILLSGFTEAFKADDNVELHILTKESEEQIHDFRSYIRQAAAPLLNITDSSQFYLLPRVYVHSHHIPDSLLPGLYGATDALVLPTRGEGWGRPQIEAMAMGKPVISTNWSGVAAFLHNGVGYPIRVEGLVEAADEGENGFEWFKHQRWAQPSKQHMKELMRQVVRNPVAAAAKGAVARKHVMQHFSLLAVARKLLAKLLRVQDVVDGLLKRAEGMDLMMQGYKAAREKEASSQNN